ncbi:MAG TPA: hypothetical protein DCS43_06105 [Verrucomicrobia bacterium]|nr:hypothetical protein [Verrucomicrobiota bacterium]
MASWCFMRSSRWPATSDRVSGFSLKNITLTPKGVVNLLVAGRCISTDHVVQSNTRVMPVYLAMGEDPSANRCPCRGVG